MATMAGEPSKLDERPIVLSLDYGEPTAATPIGVRKPRRRGAAGVRVVYEPQVTQAGGAANEDENARTREMVSGRIIGIGRYKAMRFPVIIDSEDKPMFNHRLPVVSMLLLFSSACVAFAAELENTASQPRTWTSSDGKFHTVARLVDVGEQGVVLLREGGDRVTVPREKLSRADLDYVQKYAANNAQAAPDQSATPASRQDAAAPSSKGMTQSEFLRLRLEFNLRLTRDVYQQHGKKNPVWDDAAIKFLEATAAAVTYGESNPLSGSHKPLAGAELQRAGRSVAEVGVQRSSGIHGVSQDSAEPGVSQFQSRHRDGAEDSRRNEERALSALAGSRSSTRNPAGLRLV